jgi:hypothetical protein
MKRIATLTLFVSLFLATTAFAIDGAWTAALDDDRDHLYFNITQGQHWSMGSNMSIASFANLTPSQINAGAMTPVAFEMRREAGTVAFEGTFRNGKGAGQFTFTPDRSYAGKIRALGLTLELHRGKIERTEDDDLFTLALHDVSTDFIKSMQAIGYKTTLERYLRMRIFNVTPEYVHEMQSIGFSQLDEEDVIKSKIHRVTPDFVREMRAEGYADISFDDLVRFRIHRVTKEFIDDLRAAGYDHVPPHKLVQMKIHGIDATVIKAMNGS